MNERVDFINCFSLKRKFYTEKADIIEHIKNTETLNINKHDFSFCI